MTLSSRALARDLSSFGGSARPSDATVSRVGPFAPIKASAIDCTTKARAIDCTALLAAEESHFGRRACCLARRRDSTCGDAACEPKDTTVIAGTDAKQRPADAVPLRRVRATSLGSKAADARTRPAPDSGSTLRGESRERGAFRVATARRRLRPHRAVAKGLLRSANPLIPKAATASDRTDRKNRGSFYFVGRALRVATAKRRLRPHRAVAKGLLRSANPLIPKVATASDRTDRKNWGSFYFVGSGWCFPGAASTQWTHLESLPRSRVGPSPLTRSCHPRRSRPLRRCLQRHWRRSRGTFLHAVATRKVPPLRLASLGSGRDDSFLS
jgi:hypothetical protein